MAQVEVDAVPVSTITQALAWVVAHWALIGSVLSVLLGLLAGQMPLGAAVAAIFAALSNGLKPAPAPAAL